MEVATREVPARTQADMLPMVRPPPARLAAGSGQPLTRAWRDGPQPPPAGPNPGPCKTIESVLRGSLASSSLPASLGAPLSPPLLGRQAPQARDPFGPGSAAALDAGVGCGFSEVSCGESGAASVAPRPPTVDPPKGTSRRPRHRASSEGARQHTGRSSAGGEPKACPPPAPPLSSRLPPSASRPAIAGGAAVEAVLRAPPLSAREARTSSSVGGSRFERPKSPSAATTSPSCPPPRPRRTPRDQGGEKGETCSSGGPSGSAQPQDRRPVLQHEPRQRGSSKRAASPRTDGLADEASSLVAGSARAAIRSRSASSRGGEMECNVSGGFTNGSRVEDPSSSSSARPNAASKQALASDSLHRRGQQSLSDDAPELHAESLTALLLAYGWPSMFAKGVHGRGAALPSAMAAAERTACGPLMVEEMAVERNMWEAKILKLNRCPPQRRSREDVPSVSSFAEAASMPSTALADVLRSDDVVSPSPVDPNRSGDYVLGSSSREGASFTSGSPESRVVASETEVSPEVAEEPCGESRIAAAFAAAQLVGVAVDDDDLAVGMLLGADACSSVTPGSSRSSHRPRGSCSSGSGVGDARAERWATSSRRWAAARLRRKMARDPSSRASTPNTGCSESGCDSRLVAVDTEMVVPEAVIEEE
eukprot:TRINITY_DN18151_c0_g1_i1.p1 TRINITY_DN18151_c0_g1~~TRINITY_DN18151_c0_g1_i1.p1  ORF type:complete len:650 (+),score=108.92 TRINITY_DN18151_c0_g1_i1:90-2039(+)